MARSRNIKPGFFRNADLVEISFEARLLFIGLWTIADKAGRMEDRPKQIKMELFPADNLDCDSLLSALQATGMIDRYTVGSKKYIQVVNFSKHQNPHRDEKTSVIPDKDGILFADNCVKHDASTVQALCNSDLNTVSIGLIPDSLNLIPDSLNLIPDSLNTDSLGKSKELSAPTAQTSKKGARLPADWVLPKSWGDWAVAEKPDWSVGDIRRVSEDFRDHWISKAGKDATKLDWLATWRKWVRSPLNEVKPTMAKTETSNQSAREDARVRLFGGNTNAAI